MNAPPPRRGLPRPTAPPARRSKPCRRRASSAPPPSSASKPRGRRREELLKSIAAELETDPQGLYELAGLKRDEPTPVAEVIDKRLENLKAERDRLGAVNLRADEELAEIEASRSKMAAEQADLSEAIKRLRSAISSLNAEGRERLLNAFTVVNKHFGELFTTLFEGGTAELQLIESDDPLEAGLELLARPPGKKPQTLTLLSGGEQALTAMALIFAVFLTNPSPICVLDEIDAPLDDYNVERFCDLLEEMRKRSDTRFVTDHPQSRHDGAHGPAVRRDHAGARGQPDRFGRPRHRRELPGGGLSGVRAGPAAAGLAGPALSSRPLHGGGLSVDFHRRIPEVPAFPEFCERPCPDRIRRRRIASAPGSCIPDTTSRPRAVSSTCRRSAARRCSIPTRRR